MIKQIVHIGLSVSNLERSIAFYRDILGLKLKSRLKMSGKESDILFARKIKAANIAYLNGSDEIFAPDVELIEFTGEEIKKNKADLFQTSISELCFVVKDIDALYEKLSKKGVEFLSAPQVFDFSEAGFGKSKAVYLRDPDGIILEFMEYLD